MKIIGKTERGYIVEIGGDEIANMFGKHSLNENLRVGQVVNIGKAFSKLNWINRNDKAVASVVGKLRELADMLEPIDPAVEFICGGKEA